jgi:dsRNA-specific ribonuclease
MSSQNHGQMELLYTPWMKTFLTFAANARSEILLISPFIKLSLVRPLMLALPDRQIRLRVVTRLSPQTFTQGASDILALEMLKTRPVAKGETELFRMNRLHAKVYVFDRETVLLGSSNLSISGFQRNFEMAVGVKDPHVAEQIITIFGDNKAFNDLVGEQQISALYPALGTSFDAPDVETGAAVEPSIGVQDELTTDDEVPTIDGGEVESLPEILAPVLQDDFKDRLQILSNFTLASQSAKLDSLYGGEFDSTAFRRQRRSDQTPIDPSEYTDPLQRDVAKIRHIVVPKLHIRRPKCSPDFLTGIFIEPGLLSRYPLVQGVQPDCYRLLAPLGRDFTFAVIAFHFTRQVAYDPIGAGAASLAVNQFLDEIDFTSPLIEQGLFVKLQMGDLGKKADRDLFYQIIGGIGVATGLRQGITRTLQLLEGQLEFARIGDYGVDSKTLLQQTAHQMGVSLEYITNRSGGTEHLPEFSSLIRLGKRHFDPVSGTSKREAERKAAAFALTKLESEPDHREAVYRAKGSLLSSPVSVPYQFDKRRTDICREIISILALPARTPLRLIDIALTHRSYLRVQESSRSHERLSLVGSKLIELVGSYLSTLAALNNPESPDKLARHRQLVAEAAVTVYDTHDLGRYISSGNLPQDAKTAPSFKQDIVQGLGAVAYIAGGVEALVSFFETNFNPIISVLEQREASKEEITWLQEIASTQGLPPPVYSVVRDPLSPGHSPIFVAKCDLHDRSFGPCSGRTVKLARRAAARLALIQLGVINPGEDDGKGSE